MIDHTMIVPTSQSTIDARHMLCEIKDRAYSSMLELAELDATDIVDNEHGNMMTSLETVLKYGSCHDVAHAICHYIDYRLAEHHLDFV